MRAQKTSKTMTVARMATATRLILVPADAFGTPKRHESSKTMTVARMAIATRLIFVPADTFHTPKKHESSKTMTDTGMATATRLIPVTVDTFDTQIRYRCRRFFVLTLHAGPCFISQTDPQTWPNAVIHQSSQWCCSPYL